ncbi:MAG: hypothetical protein ACOC8B_04060 [Gemmatimonadota bacterium]
MGRACSGAVQVRFSGGGFFQPCDRFNTEPLRATWSSRMIAFGGIVTARRFSGPPFGAHRCNDSFPTPCYEVVGSQTVTVTIISDRLEVEADTNHVSPGTTVTFTASTTDDTPFEVREWIWVPDAPPSDTTTGEPSGDNGTEPASDSGAAGERTVCGTDETCEFAVPEDGTMYARALVSGTVQQAGDRVEVEDIRVRILDVRSLRAKGPDDSFTSAGDEARIRVVAEATPQTYNDQIRRRVEDAPDGAPSRAPDPGSLATGDTVIWTVPAQDRTRWDAFREHPGALNAKKLGFDVTAYVEVAEDRRESTPEEIEQDEVDTVRQEYIDFGKSPAPYAAWGTPTSDHFSSGELNWGDYGVYLATDDLLRCLEAVRTLVHADYVAARRPFNGLILTSAYRNPVHNR